MIYLLLALSFLPLTAIALTIHVRASYKGYWRGREDADAMAFARGYDAGRESVKPVVLRWGMFREQENWN